MQIQNTFGYIYIGPGEKKKKRYSQVKRITQVFQGMIFGTQNT